VLGEGEAIVYNINKDYRIVKLKGNKCSLFFKNKQNQLLASLEGCQDIFSNILVANDIELTSLEKGYLLSFIRAKKYSISKEVAEVLEVSIIRYMDGREEYLSEKQLKRRIANGIDFASVYVGKLNSYSISIPRDGKDCSYNLSNAGVAKVVVEENCNINIDLRDNKSIESLVVGERFSGTINLSRSTIESIFVANNCQCNMHITDSKKCFNLQIADIYSGNLNISNSCMYALNIGYYSYADIVLTNNIIKKEIIVDDSFRGKLYASNQNVETIKIGSDCKGKIKINNHSSYIGIGKVIVGDDFAGNLNLVGDDSVISLEVGRKNKGNIDASFAENLHKLKIGKYYSGNTVLNNSSIENIVVAYGASGNIDIKNCKNLKLIEATIDNSLVVDADIPPCDIKTINGTIYYSYGHDYEMLSNVPLYKKIYRNIYNRFM